MAAIRVDFTVKNRCAIEKGANWEVWIDFVQPDGQPVALADYAPRCQIRQNALSEAILATPVLSYDPDVAGRLVVQLDALATDAIPTIGANFLEVSKYEYDIELEHTVTGFVQRSMQGFVEVVPGVTRDE